MHKTVIRDNHAHTSESYHRNILFKDNLIVVPYINFGLWEHELNPSNKTMKYIDRSYLVMKGINRLSLYKQPDIITSDDDPAPIEIFVGGGNLDFDKWIDIDVRCEEAYLLLPDDYEISEEMWIPIPTPNLPQNMDTRKVEELFSYKLAPDEIRELRSMN